MVAVEGVIEPQRGRRCGGHRWREMTAAWTI